MATSKYDSARHEFLLDGADYFKDKQDIYLKIKSDFSRKINHPISSVRVCGSAYWGVRFEDESPFEPRVSDLDVAVISPYLFAECMAQIRVITRGFTDLTFFPVRPDFDSYSIFQQYSLRKGLLRPDFVPAVPVMRHLRGICRAMSRDYLDHFKDITVCLYDTEDSFAMKQVGAMQKLRAR